MLLCVVVCCSRCYLTCDVQKQMFFTVSESPKIHHGGQSWGHLDHVGPSWDHLGATLKHLVGFENGDFTWEVLTKMTLCAIACCRVVVCGVVCSCVLLLVVCNLRCSKTIGFYSV